MAKNTIRKATLGDVPQMAQVFAAGFIDDAMYGQFMNPKRKEYPDDWMQFWNHEMRKHLIDPTEVGFVGVDSQGRIKACCLMKKLGDPSPRIAAEGFIAQKLQQVSGTVQNTLDGFTFENRAGDPKAMASFEKSWKDIEHYFVGPRAQSWFIELLCVHPDVQRGAGYGRDLLQNAIHVGESEQPPVSVAVIASEIGDAFYDKHGFREVGRADVGEISSVAGGSLKFYEQHLAK